MGSINGTEVREKFSDQKIFNGNFGIGEAPDWIPEKGRSLWDLIVNHYDGMSVLCELDAPALTSLCLAAAQQESIERKIAECEDIDEERLLVKLKKDYEATFKSYANLFGLSPKDRAALAQAMREAQIDTKRQNDPLLEALSIS